MHPELETLTQLQEVDRELLQLTQERMQYPRKRQTRLDEVRRAQAKLDEAKQEIEALEKRVRQTERQVEEWRDALKRFELQQSQVKDQKSYDALTHEMRQTLEKIAQADGEGAELLIHEDELNAKVAELEKALEIKQRACDEELRRIEARENENRSLMAHFENQREKVVSGVDDAILKRYERLSKQHPGSAVVPLDGGNCGGCHMTVTKHRLQTLREPDTINECDSCHRFLYLPDTPQA